MNIKTKLHQFRASIKADITKVIRDIYLKQNNGLHPNFDDDEEYILTSSDIKRVINVLVDVQHPSSCLTSTEQQQIYKYVVTLDNNLFFVCGVYEDERNWEELTTDELVTICDYLQTFYKKLCN